MPNFVSYIKRIQANQFTSNPLEITSKLTEIQ